MGRIESSQSPLEIVACDDGSLMAAARQGYPQQETPIRLSPGSKAPAEVKRETPTAQTSTPQRR